MLLKIALLLWFGALFVSLFVSGRNRSLMGKLFVGGFCLILLALFLKLMSRVL